jgi:hypothetical protein
VWAAEKEFMASDTVTVRLETDDDGSDAIEVPRAVVEMLGEADEDTTTVVGDLAMLGIAQQAHALVHHSHGETDAALEEAEELAMDLFEERFGQTYGEVTGHSH